MKNILRGLLIVAIAISGNSPATAAIKEGSKCSERDYKKETKIKVGNKTFQCFGADSGYYWYPVAKTSAPENSAKAYAKAACNYYKLRKGSFPSEKWNNFGWNAYKAFVSAAKIDSAYTELASIAYRLARGDYAGASNPTLQNQYSYLAKYCGL